MSVMAALSTGQHRYGTESRSFHPPIHASETSRPRIGIVANDPHLACLLFLLLQGEGFEAEEMASGAYRDWPSSAMPDLMVVETDRAGSEAIAQNRALQQRGDGFPLPVLALIPDRDEIATLDCFAAGVEDVLDLPLRPRELVARMRRILWRLRPDLSACVSRRMKPILGPAPGELSCCGTMIRLTPSELRLLGVFMRKPERVLSRQEIMRDMYGRRAADPRTIDVYVKRLRRSLSCGERRNPIRTVLGSGYAFEPENGMGPIRWLFD